MGKKGGSYDFHLNAQELVAFQKNGFVVSERMGAASFSEMLYRIYSRDLPVYIAPDAILQAWHRSYDAMLEDLETTYLSVSLDQILAGMAAAIPAANKAYGDGVLADGVKDAGIGDCRRLDGQRTAAGRVNGAKLLIVQV